MVFLAVFRFGLFIASSVGVTHGLPGVVARTIPMPTTFIVLRSDNLDPASVVSDREIFHATTTTCP